MKTRISCPLSIVPKVTVVLTRLSPIFTKQPFEPHEITSTFQVISASAGTNERVTGPPVPKILAPNPGGGGGGNFPARSCGAATRQRRLPIAAARHPNPALKVSRLMEFSFLMPDP